MSTFKERLIKEQLDLNEKVEKLKEFIEGNKVFITLPVEHQELLCRQFRYMSDYNLILLKRIELLEQTEDE